MRRALACLLAGALVSCGPLTPAARVSRKLVILAIDGLDPDLTERWIAAGRLPHLAALAAKGGLHRVEAATAPEALPVWASFATGLTPAHHGVFGSVARDPATYAGAPALAAHQPARFVFGWGPIAPGHYESLRAGTSFWVAAGQAGVRAAVLGVPGTFPPETVPNGELLSGVPLPDLGGGDGSYAYFGTDVAGTDPAPRWGVRTRLVFSGNAARANLPGPPTGDRRGGSDGAPMEVTWNREARTVNIDMAGASVHLAERQWSRWLRVEFAAGAFARARGLARVFLVSAGAQLRIYVSPIHWDPLAPPAALSYPPALAATLVERLGPYRTLGSAAGAGALSDGAMDEEMFLDEMEDAFDDRAAVLLSRLDAQRWDLFVGAVDVVDTVQHAMWRLVDPDHPAYDPGLAPRYGESIQAFYAKVDDLVGQAAARLAPGTALLVLSGYGVRPYRASVDLNAWLSERGYLVRASGRGPVTWARTRAYAHGFGQIYLNLRGREAQGVVEPGADAAALVEAIRLDLEEWRDPSNGRRVVQQVLAGDRVHAGAFRRRAPDLQVAFAAGYRASWPSAPGLGAEGAIAPNVSAWSGDHASAAAAAVPGVMVSSLAPATPPRIVDIAPTVLKYFGVVLPRGIDGRPVF